MNEQIEAEIGKKRRIEVDSLESTPKSNNISIDSLEIPKNSKNWNDLPVEMKLMCIGKMTEKSKVKLSMCSKFDQEIVKSERKQLKLEWLKEEYDPIFLKNSEEDDDCPDYVFKSALWTTNNSGDALLQYEVEYVLDPDDDMVEKQTIANVHKFLCHVLNNFEINTLKLEFNDNLIWEELDEKIVKKARKVENLELIYDFPSNEVFEFAMKFNSTTIRLCRSRDAQWFGELIFVIKRMVYWYLEIGRKIEISAIESSFPDTTRDFGSTNVAETLAFLLNVTIIVNEASYIRLALKENPNKHIIALSRPNKTIQLAVVSKDLTEIPDSFF